MIVVMYTDGSSLGNPGPGGYCARVHQGGVVHTIAGGVRYTTNNRMELIAVIRGLESLPPGQQVEVHSDSRYIVDTVNKGWLQGWLKTGFRGKRNADLWQRFWQCFQQHQVKLYWVKGHAGHPENELCDTLATQKARTNPKTIDRVYEAECLPLRKK